MTPGIFGAFWNRHFGDSLREIEADSLAYRQSAAGRRPDRKTIAVLVTVAVCLALHNYASQPVRFIGSAGFVARHAAGDDRAAAVRQTLADWGADQADSLTWWATCTVFSYAIVPMLVVKLVLRENLRDYGAKFRGLRRSWPIYAIFIGVMIPIVAVVSSEERFQQTYPFYRIHSADQVGAGFLRWELLYALQFVALEFFFRGFLLHGTKHRFGIYSAFVMVIPYCMIHFQKPIPEAAASILAGIALGFVSLTTRSIWLGAALHITVAWSMDFATLARRGMLEFS